MVRRARHPRPKTRLRRRRSKGWWLDFEDENATEDDENLAYCPQTSEMR